MAMAQGKIYLYLARRDKSSIRILSILGFGICLPTRLNDDNLQRLSLGYAKESNILNIVTSEKMDWELWVESSESFQSLKQSLSQRGYRGFPLNDNPELFTMGSMISQETLNQLPNQKTMLRKRN